MNDIKNNEAIESQRCKVDDDKQCDAYFEEKPEEVDDMFNYEKALLDYGMLLANLQDAISEGSCCIHYKFFLSGDDFTGDGQRVLRCWKFLLLYFKHDNSSSKCSLQILYMLFQVYALLSPRSAHQLVWNRFIKTKRCSGGNIPLDLNLEFLNKVVKEAIKKLGPNASKRSIDRICHSMTTTKALMENFDEDVKMYKRSGKHFPQSLNKDMQTIVNEPLHQQTLVKTPGR